MLQQVLSAAAHLHLLAEGVSEGRDNNITPQTKQSWFQANKFLPLEELQGQTTHRIKVILILKIHTNSKLPNPAGLFFL